MKNKFRTLLFGLLGIGAGTACSQKAYTDADVSQFAELCASDSVQLLDVRTVEEYAEGHLPGAVNVDVRGYGFVEKAVSQLSKDKHVAVYCRSGRRSASAASLLAKEGFRVTNLLGGINAWKEKGLAVTKDVEK